MIDLDFDQDFNLKNRIASILQYVVPVKKIPPDIFCQNQMVGSLMLYILNVPADVILKTNRVEA